MHRILVLVGLVACGHHDDKPRPTPGSAAAKKAGFDVGPARDVELLVLHEVAGTEVDPNHHIVQLHFVADQPVETKTICRTAAYNVHLMRIQPNAANAREGESILDMSEDVLEGPNDPIACEATLSSAKGTNSAAVCWRAGKVTPQPCPPGTFPPPVLPANSAIDFHVRELVAPKSGTATALYLNGEYTVGDPIDAGKLSYSLRCADVAGHATAFSPALARLGRGETVSVHGQVFEMAGSLSSMPRRCTLTIAANDKPLGAFCITDGKSSTAGACPP
ncbi:MAG TPA: hypothetical protein VIV58_35465 [Kofleriaceae bacterium]